MTFEILHQSKKSKARVGLLHTQHGTIHTPSFVAVGTNGTLKSIDNQTAIEIGLELMFCNTYHLLIQPGPDVIRQLGGLHKFINRPFPIITDSGGFQTFSLSYGSVSRELKSGGAKLPHSQVLQVNEEGVLFRSYRDGQEIFLTPESSIQAQKCFGADIIIPLDELPPFHTPQKKLYESFYRTHRWELRSLKEHEKNPQHQIIYGVIHGGLNPSLRKKSLTLLSAHNFDGFAIGGSVGKTKEEMFDMLASLSPHLPHNKPIHLLGIANPDVLDKCLSLGIDTYDSSYPTKIARHGSLLTKNGIIHIHKKIYQDQETPIDPTCSCPTCTKYSTAYLHHLFKSKELNALSMASIHNLYFMICEMREKRKKILHNLL